MALPLGFDSVAKLAAKKRDPLIERAQPLALAIGDRALAHHGIVIARQALPFRIAALRRLAEAFEIATALRRRRIIIRNGRAIGVERVWIPSKRKRRMFA